nr:MAG TPA: hypothetical protein [Bacteriophage sp.]
MATYLDNAGVTQILTKIKSLLAKKAEITAIPTKVSQLTNDSNYQDDSDVAASISTELNALRTNESSFEIITTDFEGHEYYPVVALTQTDGKISGSKIQLRPFIDDEVEHLVDTNFLATQRFVTDNVASAVGKITSFEYKIVASLPSTSEGKKGVIYLVAHSGSTTNNVYDEYIFLPAEGSTAARYEKIGTTDIDLTPYAKKTEIPTKVSQLTNDSRFATTTGVESRLTNTISLLGYKDTAEDGKYVSSVSQTDGVIKVTRASLPAVGTADSPISNATIESIFTQVFG